MNKNVKPGEQIVGPGGHNLVDDITQPAPEHFGRFWKAGATAPTWSPVPEEVPPTGKAYLRTKGVWVEAIAGGLSVTEIVPAIVTAGTAPTTLNVYGTGFTTTTVISFNGTPVVPAAVYVPATGHMTVQYDPTLAVPAVITVTANDGATVGTGAAGLHIVPASTSTPTVTEIVPALATVGFSVALQANVYGTGFIDGTSQVLWDGVPLATAFISANQLGITIDTTLGVAPSSVTVTVTGATGAAGFVFIPDASSVDAGLGLSMDKTTTPNWTINLTPAGVSQPLLGGVYVPTRDATQAADVDTSGGDGKLVVLTATDTLLGGMLEPVKDGTPYERQWNETAQKWEWVKPTATATDYGTGLSYDDTTTPPIVHLQPALPVAGTLGGVFVLTRDTTLKSGLTLDINANPATGELTAPPATDTLLGTLVDAPVTGLAYSRKWDNVTDPANPKWVWVEALTAGLQITGLIPDQVVFGPSEPLVTVHAYGSEFTPTCVLVLDGTQDLATTFVSETELTFVMNPAVPIAEQSHIITVKDPAAVPPALVDGLGAEEFKFIVPSIQVDYGTGLQFDTSTTPPIVHLQPAGPAPQFLGGVWVPPRTELQGLELDVSAAATGEIKVPLATPNLAGSIIEPPQDDKGYVRRTDITTGLGAWVPPADPIGTDFGTGLTKDETATPPIVHLQPAADSPAGLGGIYVVERTRTEIQGLELNGDGELKAPLATDLLAGSIIEPPPDDKGYVRRRDLAGVSAWVPPADTPIPDFGTGLTHDETTPPGIVHLQPAADSPAGLGGIYVVDRTRTEIQGLELNGDGELKAPLATDLLAGSIIEPPPDDKGYVRRRDTTGVSAWVPPADTPIPDFGTGLTLDTTTPPGIVHLQPAGDSAATLGGVYVIDRVRNNTEGLELGADGRLRVPVATDALLGGILEPPPDDKGYVRRRTVAGESAWVPPAGAPATDYGTGLSVDETQTPQIVHLQPAADTPAGLGGVYVVDRTRTAIQGLELNGDGELKAPLASDLLAGTHTEPTPDGLAYSRQWDALAAKWIWVPALTAGLQITSIIPDKAIYGPTEPLLTVHAYGSEFTATTVVHVDGNPAATAYVSPTELTFVMNPAVPAADQFHIITVHDPAAVPPALVDGLGAEQFDFIKASTSVDYGTGLNLDTGPTPPIVHLQPAGPAASLLGGVWVPPRDHQQGLSLYPGADPLLMGQLTLPLATPNLAGAMIEPPQDDKGYVRRTDINTGIGAWVPPADGGGGCTISDTPPANPAHEDLWWESDSGKMFIYYDDGTSAQWVEAVQVPEASGGTNAGLGLSMDETTTPNPTMNLQPAGDTAATLGGIYVVDRVRTATSGLELDIDGQLRAPLATEIYAGTIVDPPPDGLPYVRKRDTAGVSTWVPPTGGVIISDTPPPNPTQGAGWWESDSGDLFIWYDDGTSAQWVQVNGVSPPPGVTVADDPPMSPTPNALWWDSNAGTLNLWYTDVDTSQWVQIAAPQIPGVPEAPIDGVPYARRDANWVATTSLAATPGDVKDGFQVNDHGGWIKLDGRLVNTLTSTQQAQAALLGFTTNLPNAASAVGLMNGTAMGTIAGAMTKTIAQANLPAVNLTAANVTVTVNNYDFGAVNTNNALGFSDEVGIGPKTGKIAAGGTGQYYIKADTSNVRDYNHGHSVDLPSHGHTTAAHGHNVPLGGSGTPLDVTPKSMSINKFVFLGA